MEEVSVLEKLISFSEVYYEMTKGLDIGEKIVRCIQHIGEKGVDATEIYSLGGMILRRKEMYGEEEGNIIIRRAKRLAESLLFESGVKKINWEEKFLVWVRSELEGFGFMVKEEKIKGKKA